VEELNTLERTDTEVVVAPPAVYLSTVKQLTKNGPLIVAGVILLIFIRPINSHFLAQNCWKSDKGAFTGETR
jgi:triosephosphate isomerase